MRLNFHVQFIISSGENNLYNKKKFFNNLSRHAIGITKLDTLDRYNRDISSQKYLLKNFYNNTIYCILA